TVRIAGPQFVQVDLLPLPGGLDVLRLLDKNLSRDIQPPTAGARDGRVDEDLGRWLDVLRLAGPAEPDVQVVAGIGHLDAVLVVHVPLARLAVLPLLLEAELVVPQHEGEAPRLLGCVVHRRAVADALEAVILDQVCRVFCRRGPEVQLEYGVEEICVATFDGEADEEVDDACPPDHPVFHGVDAELDRETLALVVALEEGPLRAELDRFRVVVDCLWCISREELPGYETMSASASRSDCGAASCFGAQALQPGAANMGMLAKALPGPYELKTVCGYFSESAAREPC
ncbi:hypothetical protein GE09DRAFT_1071056, partial [Coniochaeta sp. 2T2.1]